MDYDYPMNSQNPISFKVILLGDAGVGKTSLINRKVGGVFSPAVQPTQGLSYSESTIEIDGTPIALKLWDTAGQERYAPLVSMYVRGASACIYVSSFDNQESIQHIDEWMRRVDETTEQVVKFFVVNKMDLAIDSEQYVQSFKSCFKNEPYVFFTSAKTGLNVDDVFVCVARTVLGVSQAPRPLPVDTVAERSSCC